MLRITIDNGEDTITVTRGELGPDSTIDEVLELFEDAAVGMGYAQESFDKAVAHIAEQQKDVADAPLHTSYIQSETDPSVWHTVVRSCTCPGFKYRQTCKHVK